MPALVIARQIEQLLQVGGQDIDAVRIRGEQTRAALFIEDEVLRL